MISRKGGRAWATAAAAVSLVLALTGQKDLPASTVGDSAPGERDWPAITRETRPWTRWWWQGSAVETASLTSQLEALRTAGIGGVEITPIYGVRGTENRFITYLSDAWLDMLEHALREARRLDLGVDLATGTGWPFGGPWVDEDMAPRSIVSRSWTLAGGTRLSEPVRLQQQPLVRALGNQIHVVDERASGDPQRDATQPLLRPGARAIQITDLREPVTANANLQALALEQVKYPRELPLTALMAFGDRGQEVDLVGRVGRDGLLDWTAPPGRWTLHAVFAGWHGKLVERAAPGGEGNVIDHFSRDAIRRYLARFDRAFSGRNLSGVRAFFNDSYEVDDATGQADWTPRLFEEFRTRRGYDLRRYLPDLLDPGKSDLGARVLADYRETISDLLLEAFTAEWSGWARRSEHIVRNQAHGSPGSILDLYAASDIPETEGTEIERFRWATSAAHVAGRRLVSAEAATWLGEHFLSTLDDVRTAIDRFFVAGVNHIVYHGTAYSPVHEPWPGWLFYAAVEFSPQNAWWDDFSALNDYVARVQSFLQSGRPDHDVLLYYPLYDALATTGSARLTHFGTAGPPARETVFASAASEMERSGVTYDLISDRQLRGTHVEGGRLLTPGNARYRAVVLPSSRFIPLETFEHLLSLVHDGATVLSLGDWPADVSGLANLDARRRQFRKQVAAVRFEPIGDEGIGEALIGRGRILRGNTLQMLLARAGVERERMVDLGMQFHRRIDSYGRFYFIANPGERSIDGWVPLRTEARSIIVFDPMSGTQGTITSCVTAQRECAVRLQIPARGSLVVAESSGESGTPYPIYETAGESLSIGGPWTLRFDKGGPSLPAPRTLPQLTSWTSLGPDGEVFSGTASYQTTIPRPPGSADAWQLDLGVVHESARVRLNGRHLATLIGPPYRVVLDKASVADVNVLEVTVTNLSANRIRDLDRRGVPWKKFYNVNFPARLPQNRGPDGLFTAAAWEPLESGLRGPVTLTPLSARR